MSWKNLLFPTIWWGSLLLLIEGIGIGISYHQYRSLSMQFDKECREFQTFQKRGVTAIDLAQIEEEKKKYTYKALEFIRSLQKRQIPLERSITPQSFQDKLREHVSFLTHKKQQTVFPLNFYLGFDIYRSTLPPKEITAELDQELEIIFSLLHQFTEIPVEKILSIYRFPFSKKSPELIEPPHLSQELNKRTFDISFLANQTAFRRAFNTILNFSHFLSIEALQVRNSEPHALFEKQVHTDANNLNTNYENSDSALKIQSQEKIRRLFLKEKLIVNMRISLFSFQLSEENFFKN